jgi:hypothetical protein
MLIFWCLLLVGLSIAGLELFSIVSARLDMVCMGFVLVAGGLVGVLSNSLAACFSVVICLVIGYFLFLRERVRRWIEQAEKA